MDANPGLKWLFLDLNSYFASVEQQENPHLRGKPVAVVPMPVDATCAIAASYEAKAYGIKTGTKIYEAKQMCPGLQCVLARHDKYVEYHHRILAEIIKHIPINKVCSIDELSSRLPPNKRNVEAATRISRNIKEGLKTSIGPYVTCSIGVAPNALLAKMAGDTQKPDGLTIWRPEDLPEALFALKLTDIPGVGHNMERRLHRAGIHTMEQLWHTSPKQARKIWNSVVGERMWYWLHGYDFEPPETGNVMIGHSRMLDPDLRPPAQARLMARRLLTKATTRLRRKGYYAGALSLSVRTVDGRRWGGELRFPPARDPFTFLGYLEELWQGMMLDLSLSPPPTGGRVRVVGKTARANIKLKKISTVLHGLRTDAQVTTDLFDTRHAENVEELEKREALTSALEKLQGKYHKETVTLGTVPKTLSGHVGTKIAFARVPDSEEFWG